MLDDLGGFGAEEAELDAFEAEGRVRGDVGNECVDVVLGTQVRPSCCSGVFVDQSAESVAAAELVWRAWADEASRAARVPACQPERAVRPVAVVGR